MDILLTIAVPTFNRVEKLKRCLCRLVEEVQGRPVELLVSDNASTDGTETFMQGFIAAHPEVTYTRNAENIGPDRNFLNCFAKAKGEYVFLLGDDDVLLPGALDNILDALRQKPVFVHLNTSNLLAEEPLSYSPPHMPEGETRTYTSKDALMQDMGIFVTFVSSLVMRTDLIRQIPDKEQYIGTYFIQSHIALRTIAADGQYMFITKNCVAATGNERVNYDVYYVWGEQYTKLLWDTAVGAGVSQETVQKIHQHDLENYIYSFVVTLRFTSPNSDKWNKACIMAAARKNPKMYPHYVAMVYLPKWGIKAITSAKKWLKKCIGR